MFPGSLGPAALLLWDGSSVPLVTFSLFAVVAVLLRLGSVCLLLLLVLPLLCVVGLGGGRVRPKGDDNAGHVVTSGTISRCVGGQTVLQQLSGGKAEFQIKDSWAVNSQCCALL